MGKSNDLFSSVVRQVLALDSDEAYSRLVVSGTGRAAAKSILSSLKPADLDSDNQRAAVAGLWLWHDWLAESHAISQSLHTPAGSYWHAILHRRDGDFWNSKYWYARIGDHPALSALAARARGNPSLSPILPNGFDSAAFVDLVEKIHHAPSDPRHPLAVSIQRLEWQTLFEFCINEPRTTNN